MTKRQPEPKGNDRPDRSLGLRRALLLLVLGTALLAIFGGLSRLGIVFPLLAAGSVHHGSLFVLGVFLSLISLERALALAHPLAASAPILGVLGTLLLPVSVSVSLFVSALASACLAAVSTVMYRRQPAAFTGLPVVAALLLTVGSVRLLLGSPVFSVVPLWQSFFILTIVAERLELSRLVKTPPSATKVLLLLALVLSTAALLRHLAPQVFPHVFGLAMALIALWQLRHDVARRTVRQSGLPRFVAFGVLGGALWLLLSGLLWLCLAIPPVGPRYDAAVHGVLIGYVLSMVVAHAPIIFPTVAKLRIPFTRLLYLPLGLLQIGLALRLAADLLGLATIRQLGGVLNAAVLPVLLLSVLLSVHSARRTAKPSPSTFESMPHRVTAEDSASESRA